MGSVKIILNGGSLEIAEYDISRPPTLATSSVATPSRATSSNAEREDMVIRNGFIEIKENESRNTSITVYKSNIYFEVGSRLDILDGNNRNTISENMRQFISKNGNKNQIFFVSVQPPSTERENGENREIMSKVLSSSQVENIALREWAQSANNSSGERGESGKRSSQKSGRAGIGEGKASQKSGGESVIAKSLTLKGWMILATTVIVGTLLFVQALNAAGGSSTGLDGLTTIITVSAQLLMILRYREQWLLWILLNILSIALWAETPAMYLMYSAYLLNSLYGYYNWTKLMKQA